MTDDGYLTLLERTVLGEYQLSKAHEIRREKVYNISECKRSDIKIPYEKGYGYNSKCYCKKYLIR